MSMEYRLPKELQETHQVVSQIDITADPFIIQMWLSGMENAGVKVVLSSYRSEFVAYVPNKEEPEVKTSDLVDGAT